jgi:flagellar basal body rod protein FlgC
MSSISSTYSVASYGLNTAANQLSTTAQKIAGFGSNPTDTGDLVQNVVDLSTEKTAFKANAIVLKSADQMLGSLLDIFDTHR